jgi:membrane protein YqaA with SNARE-associated domain
MSFFTRLYQKTLALSSHHRAPYYLAGVSFVESSFFPIPPDVMLIPMVLSRPLKAWQFAFITTIGSILGGLFGYLLGYYAFHLFGEPLIATFHYEVLYERVVQWFDSYGFLAVCVAGFTPIPYKLFTLGAGATHMNLLGFLIASFLGRGLRFYLVVALVKTVGKKVESMVIRYMEWIGWSTVALTIIGAVWYTVLR